MTYKNESGPFWVCICSSINAHMQLWLLSYSYLNVFKEGKDGIQSFFETKMYSSPASKANHESNGGRKTKENPLLKLA